MISKSFSLEGKTALVTGAATGLGRGIAAGLAGAGADVVGAVHRKPANETRADVEAAGRRFFEARGDLGDPSSVPKLLTSALDHAPRIDILINNAGIIRRSDFLDFTVADWDAVMDVNLKSLFLLSQAAVKHMVETAPDEADGSAGKVIHIASLLSYQGGIRVPSYTASKHGVQGLTRLMANELAAKRINVNAIAPGYFATDNTQALQDDPIRSRQILERIPAARWGQPEDLQGATVFLASSASDYVHGTTLAVDGGWMAR
ncbi:MAG: 2-dehydro-3-deoxy-D-gluconate 5-dehydrogenase KduD [Planctomycetota bacterium]